MADEVREAPADIELAGWKRRPWRFLRDPNWTARQLVPPDNVEAVSPHWRPVPPRGARGTVR